MSGDNTGSTANSPSPAPTRMARSIAWMRRNSTHVLIVGVVVAVVGAVSPLVATGLWDTLFGAKPAQCPGAGCDGKGPQEGGCGVDAVTWSPAQGNPTGLQIRYSARCGAVWGRITKGEKGDKVTVSVRSGGAQEAVIESNHDNFTKMAATGASFQAEVCAIPSISLARSGTWSKYCISATEKTDWTP